jgi:hypothetical protein
MPPPITCFYHAIYKRLWTVARVANAHMDDGTEGGGFTLRSPGEPAGIFGTITSGSFAGQSPLTPGSFVRTTTTTRSTGCCCARSIKIRS